MSRLIRPRRPAIGSWPDGWVVRSVTRDDLRALIGTDMDPEYCAVEPVGYAGERDGVLVAAGSVTWDRRGWAWGWLNCRERVPTRILHSCALEMLARLRQVGEPHIRMVCSLSIDGAERWVRHLGFVPDETLTHPRGPVFRCDLSGGAEIAAPISEIATGI